MGATVVNTEGKKIEHLKKSLPNTLKIKCTIVNTKINTIQQINATKGIKVQQKYTKLEKKRINKCLKKCYKKLPHKVYKNVFSEVI